MQVCCEASPMKRLLFFWWNSRTNEVVIAHTVSDETIDQILGITKKTKQSNLYVNRSTRVRPNRQASRR